MANVTIAPGQTAAQTNANLSKMFIACLVRQPMMQYIKMGERLAGSLGTFKWAEEARAESVATLASSYSTSGTVVVGTGEGARFAANDRFHIEGHLDSVGIPVVFNVTSVSTDTITVTVVGGTDTALTAASQRVFITKSYADASTAPTGTGYDEPTILESYFELKRKTISLGKILQREVANGAAQGVQNAFERARDQRMNDLAYDVYRSTMHGVGKAPTASIPGKTKSIMQLVNTAATENKVNASSAALTEAMINTLYEQLYLRGLPSGEQKVLVMHPSKARRLADLRKSNVTYVVDGTGMGSPLKTYTTDLADVGTVEVIADPNFETSLILAATPSMVEMVMPSDRGALLEIKETTEAYADLYGQEWSMTIEFGIKVLYGTRYHGIIYGLA